VLGGIVFVNDFIVFEKESSFILVGRGRWRLEDVKALSAIPHHPT
jgi:hypothetical protein